MEFMEKTSWKGLTYTPKNGHISINLLFHTHQVIYSPKLIALIVVLSVEIAPYFRGYVTAVIKI